MANGRTLKCASEDRRAVKEAMIAVDQALTQAAIAARALVADTQPLKDKVLCASAHRLLRIISAMKAGPNVKVWEEIRILDESVNEKLGQAR